MPMLSAPFVERFDESRTFTDTPSRSFFSPLGILQQILSQNTVSRLSFHVCDDDLLESIDRCSDERFVIRCDLMLMSITREPEQERHALIAIRINRNEPYKEKSHRKSLKDIVEKDNRKEKSISLRRPAHLIQVEQRRCRSNLHDRQTPVNRTNGTLISTGDGRRR